MKKSRIYVVTNNGADSLVQAHSKAGAISYRVRKEVQARIASQVDLVLLLQTREIESALEEPQEVVNSLEGG